MIDNLLSNAITCGGGMPIRVRLFKEAGAAILAFQDQRIGIFAEDHARLFERFEQAVGQRQQGGFGVGLWRVRQLVEAIDGRITVESRLGQVSTFTVRFNKGAPASSVAVQGA